ncbi:hypothetical protein J437_LFUL015162 [Ladona fulva]|uniref:Uncharacterized protein n=1 Tax=Ladona fulva TaxID=123851 RepID=A0A8K0KHZ8_LADFU|nr:hypothetical protein J437_LFUL015162 [Ladona fulva]
MGHSRGVVQKVVMLLPRVELLLLMIQSLTCLPSLEMLPMNQAKQEAALIKIIWTRTKPQLP